MRAVAERADVALGTLYRYFPSKIHLLVCALGARFEEAEERLRGAPVAGGTPHERVMQVIAGHTRALQRDQHLTEAMTRAFMFADASVAEEIRRIEALLTSMLTRAMAPGAPTASAEHLAVARVLGDVWLASLVGWVTGRRRPGTCWSAWTRRSACCCRTRCPRSSGPGNTCAAGSMTTAALLTAVAASPKPTAISRTLPGYSVMSPAAKTRGRLVRIAESTTTCRFAISSPQLLQRPEVGDEAERGDHGLGRPGHRGLAVDGDLDLRQRAVRRASRSPGPW